MNKGWKPLPVVLKIIFIILVFRSFLAVFSLSPSYNNGYEFFVWTLYGLYAINGVFILNLLLPLILLVGMFQRYSKIWIVGVIYFFIFTLSTLFSLANTTEMLGKIIGQMPEMFQLPAGMDENDFQKLLSITLSLSIIFTAAFNLTMMIFFAVKRKYFLLNPEEISPESEKDLTP